MPPGNSGFNMQDGTEYKGHPGGSVTVSEEHAAAVRRQVGGDAVPLLRVLEHHPEGDVSPGEGADREGHAFRTGALGL